MSVDFKVFWTVLGESSKSFVHLIEYRKYVTRCNNCMDSYEYIVYKNEERTHVKIYISLKNFLYV